MKKTIAIALLLAVSTQAQALTLKGDDKGLNTKALEKQAQKMNLQPSKVDRRSYIQFEKLKKKSTMSFDEMVADNLNNSADVQSVLYQVRDGVKKTSKAMKIAKAHLINIVKKNFSKIKNTTVNENAVETWDEFLPNLKHHFESTHYYSQNRKGEYLFKVGDWAEAYVSPSMDRVKWKIQINHLYDHNKLQAGAEKITVPKTPPARAERNSL